MDLRFVPPDLRRLDEAGAELLACCIWSDQWPMRGLAGLLDWRLAGRLSALAREAFLLGELGEVLWRIGDARPFRRSTGGTEPEAVTPRPKCYKMPTTLAR